MKKILTALVLTLLFVSCSNDNDDNLTTPLEGKWTLTNVSCFYFFGDSPDFSGHKLIFKNNDVQVGNNGEFKYLINASGEYTINGNMITFQDGNQYIYVVNLDVLELTYVDEPGIADDELFLEYKRG